MKVKNRKNLIRLLALSQIGTVATQIAPLVVNAEVNFDSINSFTPETRSRLDNAKNTLEAAKKTRNNSDVKKAIVAFTNVLPTGHSDSVSMDNYFAEDNEELQSVYDGLHDLVYNKVDNGEKNNLSMYLLNQMVLKRGNDSQVFMNKFINQFVEGNTNSSIKDKIDTSIRNLNAVIGEETQNEESNSNNDELKDSGNDEVVLVNPPDLSEAVKTPVAEETVEVMAPGEDAANEIYDAGELTWEDISYETVDGVTVQVTTTYTQKDGVITSSVKRDIVPMTDAYAGTMEDWKQLNDVSQLEVNDTAGELIEENKNILSNLTLHYTVTKATDEVYYYDTGIRVNEEGTATYQQVKDVLYQLALRADGYLTDDKGKFLIVVEGKPILIKEVKDSYSKKEIEEMFDGFKEVDMRIMETRIGTTASLEEQIVSGQAQKVTLDGESVDLKNNPTTKNSRVLLPIEEIAKVIGAKVEKDGEKIVVSKDDNVAVYETNVKSVVINGTAIEVNVPSEKTKSGELMGEVTELLKAFGYDLIWDEENSTIQLTTNE